MKNLKNILVIIVLLVCGVNVFGDDIYTAANFVSEISLPFGGGNTYWTNSGFTFDGAPPVSGNDVYVVGISRFPDGLLYLNVAGRSWGSFFSFNIYGDGDPNISLLELYIIIDDGDDNILSVTSSGRVTIGLAGDTVLTSSSLSLGGGNLGDISSINYVPGRSEWVGYIPDTIAVITPPILLTSPKIGAVGVDPNGLLAWSGEVGATYDVYIWEESEDPVLIAYDLTSESYNASADLDWNTTYYWTVEMIVGEDVFSSQVWTFTTSDYVCQQDLDGDVNGDCKVDMVDFALLVGNWLVEVPKVVP